MEQQIFFYAYFDVHLQEVNESDEGSALSRMIVLWITSIGHASFMTEIYSYCLPIFSTHDGISDKSISET